VPLKSSQCYKTICKKEGVKLSAIIMYWNDNFDEKRAEYNQKYNGI
jgi:hypothetical protein